MSWPLKGAPVPSSAPFLWYSRPGRGNKEKGLFQVRTKSTYSWAELARSRASVKFPTFLGWLYKVVAKRSDRIEPTLPAADAERPIPWSTVSIKIYKDIRVSASMRDFIKVKVLYFN